MQGVQVAQLLIPSPQGNTVTVILFQRNFIQIKDFKRLTMLLFA